MQPKSVYLTMHGPKT